MSAPLTLDTFVAANRRAGGTCSLAPVVAALSSRDREALFAAFQSPVVTSSAIGRVLRERLKFSGTAQIVRRHRLYGCRECGIDAP